MDFQKTLLRRTGKAIHDYTMIVEGDRIAVGVSGGKDSLALLDALLLLQKRSPVRYSLHAFTVEQGKFVRPVEPLGDYMKQRGVEWTYYRDAQSFRLIDEQPDHGCDLCSRYRRRAVYEIAKELGANVVALGHTQDDFCEALLRNTLYTGRLSALPAATQSRSGEFRLIRPLVYTSEEITQGYAEQNAIPITPCVCSYRSGTVRDRVRTFIDETKKHNPHVLENILGAMQRIDTTRLLDRRFLNDDAALARVIDDPLPVLAEETIYVALERRRYAQVHESGRVGFLSDSARLPPAQEHDYAGMRESDAAIGWERTLLRVLTVAFLLFLFLSGVKGLGDGFKLLGRDLLESFFAATENPFVGLMVGLLATTLVQSSSVSTSLIVALVAAPENPLPIANAVPMIMGTNIGTTVTNTLVSLAHMTRRDEFRRAFAVATCHDFFNFFAVAVLLPLELATGFLQHSAEALSGVVSGLGGMKFESPLKPVLNAGVYPFIWLSERLFDTEPRQGAFIAIGSAVMIVAALILLVRTMRAAMESRVEAYVTRFLGGNALGAILIGTAVTVMVQSSSITTSLLVPLAGAGVLTLEQAFPITLGANIGTTVTALLASMAVSGANAQAGVAIALVHFLFNTVGTLMVYPIAAIRRIPLGLARRFAEVAVRSRVWAVLYIVILFYALPALFAFLNR